MRPDFTFREALALFVFLLAFGLLCMVAGVAIEQSKNAKPSVDYGDQF